MQQTSQPSPMSADARAMMLFEANKSSIVVAYLLWWFLGWAGGHRFYMGRPISAIMMLLLSVIGTVLSWVLVGFLLLVPVGLWWLIDAFLIPGWIRDANYRLARELGAHP